MPLRNKVILKSSIVIAAACIFYLLYYRFSYLNSEKFIYEVNLNRLDLGVVAIENNIDKLISEVEVLANIDIISDSSFSLEQKLEFLTRYKEQNKKLRIYIGDLEGKGYSNYNELQYFQEYDFFENAIKNKTTLSSKFYNYQEDKWVCAVAAPIKNNENKITGWIALLYDINELKDLIDDVNLGEGTVNFIIDSKNKIVVADNEIIDENLPRTGIIDNNNEVLYGIKELQGEIANSSLGTSEYTFENRSMRAFYKPIENTDWVFVSSVSEKEIHDFIVNTISIPVLSMAVCVFAVVGLYIYLAVLGAKLKYERKKSNVVMNASNMFVFSVNDEGQIFDCNNNFINALGYEKENLVGKSIYGLISKEYYYDFDVYFKNIFNQKNVSELEMPVVGADGKLIYVLWNINNKDIEKINQVEFIGINITTIKEYERKVQALAYFNQLTGLYNLTYLEEYFNGVAVLNNKNSKMALIYIDMDNFNYINDMFGHSEGDKVIVEICNKVNSIRNDKVKVCHHGGDEIVILYENFSDRNELDDFIKNVEKAVRGDYEINNIKVFLTLSIAVSIYPEDGTNYVELFNSADIAMTELKKKGKNNVIYFNNGMKNDIKEQYMIASELKEAIKNDEFVIYFQPQYTQKGEKLCGFEALIRWLNPRHGYLQPGKFLKQAEKNQLIIPLGMKVLEQSCEFASKLKNKGFNGYISINLSICQLMSESFEESVFEILKKNALTTENLRFEISENFFAECLPEVMSKIKRLSDAGIWFSIDNFGRGEVSLNYLIGMPIKAIKIDKYFIDTIMDDDCDETVLNAIIAFAKAANLQIIASGIESFKQFEWFNKKDIEIIMQGFYFKKPALEDVVLEEVFKEKV